MQHSSWVVSFLLLLGTVGAAIAQEDSERFEKVAQRLVQAINAEDYTAIRQNCSQAMLEDRNWEKSKLLFTNVVIQFGKIGKLDSPRRANANSFIFLAHCSRRNLDITVTLDERDKIAGLSFLLATETYENVVHQVVKAINAQDYAGIRRDFSQAMLDDLPLEKSKQLLASLVSEFGKIEKLDPPQRTAPNSVAFLAHCARRDLDITVTLDEQNKIAGLSFRPPTAQAIPVPRELETSFHLPFDGRWLVFWGGDSRELNHHHDSPNQRFAFDFLVVDEVGQSHQDDGKRNEDYYVFGKPVLAPADGVVTDVIMGVRDNTPGSMNPAFAGGNTVIVMHKEHEISVLCHFQQGSIRVKPGDKVKQGQILGLCGNSGNSSEPHIHFHVQNTPITSDATGLRCEFKKIAVTKNGQSESKTNYSPVKGDLIKQE